MSNHKKTLAGAVCLGAFTAMGVFGAAGASAADCGAPAKPAVFKTVHHDAVTKQVVDEKAHTVPGEHHDAVTHGEAEYSKTTTIPAETVTEHSWSKKVIDQEATPFVPQTTEVRTRYTRKVIDVEAQKAVPQIKDWVKDTVWYKKGEAPYSEADGWRVCLERYIPGTYEKEQLWHHYIVTQEGKPAVKEQWHRETTDFIYKAGQTPDGEGWQSYGSKGFILTPEVAAKPEISHNEYAWSVDSPGAEYEQRAATRQKVVKEASSSTDTVWAVPGEQGEGYEPTGETRTVTDEAAYDDDDVNVAATYKTVTVTDASDEQVLVKAAVPAGEKCAVPAPPKGPAGPAGPSGPAGPAGPSGPAGPVAGPVAVVVTAKTVHAAPAAAPIIKVAPKAAPAAAPKAAPAAAHAPTVVTVAQPFGVKAETNTVAPAAAAPSSDKALASTGLDATALAGLAAIMLLAGGAFVAARPRKHSN